ncbi:MAG: hypothetical protein ABJ327_24380 [Litoreibacter sp.]
MPAYSRQTAEYFPLTLPFTLGLGRLRLRGPCGANDEFLLAAIAQNLRKLAKHCPAAYWQSQCARGIFRHRSKRAKPDKKGARAAFRARLSALATRCFSVELALNRHLLQGERMAALPDKTDLGQTLR